MSIFCSKNEIIHQTSCSHISQQNRVNERKHRHILDIARTMMIHMRVLKYLWSDAVLGACHLINRMPSSDLDGKFSFSCLYPNESVFFMKSRVFCCTCFVQNFSPELINYLLDLSNVSSLDILELKKDTGVIIPSP